MASASPNRAIARPQEVDSEQAASILCVVLLLFPTVSGMFGWITENGAFSVSVTAMMIFKFQIILPVFALAFIAHCWLGGVSPAKAFFGLPPFVRVAIVAIGIMALVNGSIAAPQPLHALTRAILWLIALAFGLTIAALGTKLDRAWFQKIAFSTIGGMLLYTLVLVAFVATRTDPALVDWVEAIPGYDNVRYMGYAYAAAYGLTLGCLACAEDTLKDRRLRGVLFGCLMVFATVLFWSGSRGAILAIVAATIVMCCIHPHLCRKLLVPFVLSITISAFAATLHTVPDVNYGILRFTDRFGQGIEHLSPGRIELWKGAVDAIMTNPWLGYGEGQMKFVVQAANYTFLHPHNIVLQMLLAWGLPGGMLALLLIGYGWLRSIAPLPVNTSSTLPFVMMLSTILAHSLVDGTLFFAQPLIIAAMAAGLSLSRPNTDTMVSPAGFEPATY